MRVVVDAPEHAGLGALDYRCATAPPAGALVRVPLGRRVVTGIVWPGAPGAEAEDATLRPIAEVLDAIAPLPPAWLELAEFAAGYYQRALGELALAALPAELRKVDAVQLGRRLRRNAAAPIGQSPTAGRPLPTAGQDAALSALGADGVTPATTLLQGVTGSGKTEVYLRQAERALDAGRQVLVLVPEINLTPQFEARLAARFPDRRVVALHSALTPARRLRHWLQAHAGEADLVLGTRMAVWVPLPRPGLIVVDEEHDPSFKQQEGARYSARDLAVYRGRLEGVPVILGSATPSLESWHHAMQGRYRRLVLAERVGGGALPRVRVFDMGRLPRERGSAPALAPPIVAAISERIARGEQSLLLLNRRGYAPVLHCPACGWKSDCPHCSAWRVFHKIDRTLRCHHCGLAERVPRACPDCGNLDIAPIGRGTERLQEQISALLPEARVGRIDADTTRRKGELQAQLDAVHAGDVDLLVGTQMVAKGHDFRRMTLAVAVNPDGALFASDFRAPERLFALLMQAAGRAGRDAGQSGASEMWVQTWHPQHALYAALARHDFDAFAAAQLDERRTLGLPPFVHLALLRAEARDARVAQAFLLAAVASVEADPAVTTYAVVPAPMARVAGIERMQLLVESASRPALQRWLPRCRAALLAARGAHRGLQRWAIDVDPIAV